ncbi:MAG: hypothetical protein KDD37_02430, partial [Bdellovibrionales bacterium]|nr:hypothetical protein [Bdellovibrionales bacterium]
SSPVDRPNLKAAFWRFFNWMILAFTQQVQAPCARGIKMPVAFFEAEHGKRQMIYHLEWSPSRRLYRQIF